MQLKLRATFGVLAIAGLLSACDLAALGPTTPFTEALTALRRGDRDALRRAKEQAQALAQVTRPRGCGLEIEAQRKRGEVALITKLDNERLFNLPEHERLVYAFNVLVQYGGDDLNEPIEARIQRMRAGCSLPAEEQKALKTADARSQQEAGIALKRGLDIWFAATQFAQGSSYDANMKEAARHLTSIGLPSRWPPVTFVDGPTGTVQVFDGRPPG